MPELHTGEDPRGKRCWAVVRFVLGITQMTGAVAAFLLIAQTGLSNGTFAVVILTCLFTTVSVLLFGRRMPRRIR